MTICAVLLSLGRNPLSGRPRLPPSEAAAIALALRAGLSPRLVHAGPADAAAPLRRGLGLGGSALEILDLPPEADPVAALVGYLASAPPELLLTGGRSETGESSGLIPFLLARALGRPVVSDCIALDREDGIWVARSRLAGGHRRRWGLSGVGAVLALPASATAGALGSTLAAQARSVTVLGADAPADPRHARPAGPARRVPPRLSAPREDEVASGRTLADPEAAADEVLALLSKRGLL